VAINLRTIRDGEAAPPAQPLTVSRTRTSRRILIDRLSSRLVVLGGIVVIASILAILLVIAVEVYPLFVKPTASLSEPIRWRLPVRPPPATRSASTSTARWRFVVTRSGAVALGALDGKRALPPVASPTLGRAAITTVASAGCQEIATSPPTRPS